MAFNIAAPQFFEHTLKSLPAGPDGTAQSMALTYRVVPDEAASVNLADPEATTAFLHACVHDIEDIVAEDGTRIPFSAELLEQLAGSAHLRLAMARGYGIGLGKAALGN